MTVGEHLRDVVLSATPALEAIPETDASRSPQADAWSPKQVIGHLVDSASNNHQRFVRARFKNDLVFDGYDGDAWVAAQQYADAPWSSLVTLWREFNLHLARVIDSTPEGIRLQARERHNLGEIAFRKLPEPPTLEAFMSDYVDHLQHHLAQVIDGYISRV
ncbi:MAG TPA: DinB family protein [Thermoanaerobaculia bacterium]